MMQMGFANVPILRCEFLIQSRGQEYISNIQDAHFHLGETVVRGFVPFWSACI